MFISTAVRASDLPPMSVLAADDGTCYVGRCCLSCAPSEPPARPAIRTENCG